jgi:hypothetical protein
MLELPFREVWAVDFEFTAPPGERPEPQCLVAHELKRGRNLRLWRNEMGAAAPYDIGPDSLFVAYYASAELGCHRVLGWGLPRNTLDLFVEFRVQTNGRPLVSDRSLLGALAHFGLDGMGALEKDEMRSRIIQGPPYTEQERITILDYCEGDVIALARLLPPLLRNIDLPRALLRGRFMGAVATMEHIGVPVDAAIIDKLKASWDDIKLGLVAAVDADFGVYDGTTFKYDKFDALLARNSMAWPRLPSGQLELTEEAFDWGAVAYPQLMPLRELVATMRKLNLAKLAVGKDGRNRCLLSPFRTKTGRNAPSNSKFVFGPSRWIRGLIKPPAGYGVSYLDWSAQEWAICAALSGDENMMDAYQSGDPYLWLGKHAGVIPADADKSHPAREQFKVCALAVMYGAGANRIATTLNQSVLVGRNLIEHHKQAFPTCWRWLEAVVDDAMLTGSISTVYGFRLHMSPEVRSSTVLNFPMQANGAEMLRLACMLGIEAGIEIVAPVHDAVLIAAPLYRLDDDVATMRAIMRKAGAHVLAGFDLRTDVKTVTYPDRYMDGRGQAMWDRVMGVLGGCYPATTEGVIQRLQGCYLATTGCRTA